VKITGNPTLKDRAAQALVQGPKWPKATRRSSSSGSFLRKKSRQESHFL
jgi:hypothetical protein